MPYAVLAVRETLLARRLCGLSVVAAARAGRRDNHHLWGQEFP